MTESDIATKLNDDTRTRLERIASGKTLAFIARESGCSELALSEALSKAPPKALRKAHELGVAARLAAGKIAIARAKNAFELARAREAFKAEMWLAECEFPDRWRQAESTRPLQQGTPGTPEGPLVKVVLSKKAAENAKQPPRKAQAGEV